MRIRDWEPKKRHQVAHWLKHICNTHQPQTPSDLIVVAEREAAVEINIEGDRVVQAQALMDARDDWEGLMTAARFLIVAPQRLRVIVRLRFCGPGGPPNYILVEPGEVVEAVHLSELDNEHRKSLNRAQKRAGSDLIVPFRRGDHIHWGLLGQDLEAL